MAGPDPAIHGASTAAWITGSSPVMTIEEQTKIQE
jgi:hypothetical protein